MTGPEVDTDLVLALGVVVGAILASVLWAVAFVTIRR